MQLINTQRENLGLCLYDTYRADGDLHVTIDIVKQQSDGSFARLPDARYGVNQPDYPYCLDGTNDEVQGSRHVSTEMTIETEYYDDNGHTKVMKTWLGDGKHILTRTV